MATVARTKQDVDNMTKQDRLWDSLSHDYGKQREESDRSFDKAYSQADRQALSRGMQRSSYNAQNLANINNQKIKAQNNIWDAQIADYENRLNQQEQQDLEADRWERSFAEQQKQNEWSRNFQQQQADTQNNQWQMSFNAGREDAAFNKGMQEKQFEANQAQNTWQQNFQQSQADLAAQQWEKSFAQGNDTAERQLAASYVSSIVANGGIPSDELLARAGLSRADAEAMRKKSTGVKKQTTPDTTGNNPPSGNPDDMFGDLDLASLLPTMNIDTTTHAKAGREPVLVDNNNGNPNRYQSPNNATINPIEAAFSSPRIQTTANPVPVVRTPIDDKVQSTQERLSGGKKSDRKYSDATWSAYH